MTSRDALSEARLEIVNCYQMNDVLFSLDPLPIYPETAEVINSAGEGVYYHSAQVMTQTRMMFTFRSDV